MSKHHNTIVKFKLRLLEEPGEKTFGVPLVYAVPYTMLYYGDQNHDKIRQGEKVGLGFQQIPVDP